MDIEKLKAGKRYNWTRRDGIKARGELTAITIGQTGAFAVMAIVDEKGKKTGQTGKVRPSQLSA